MGLIPVDGGSGGARDRLASSCHFCGEPSAGPCAWCRLPICSAEPCSTVFREEGLPLVVLCSDCAKRRPLLAARAWTAPLLLGAGGVTIGLSWALAPESLASLGSLAGGLLIIVGLTASILRWQWRSRLARARGAKSKSPGPRAG